jgi:hypothetical protein
MMPFLGPIAVLALGLGAPADPGPDDLHALFTEANRLFSSARSKEELQDAAQNYRSILARVRNGPIHYNLGCTHLRLRELGPAILNLRRALLYRPGDRRAAITLEKARAGVPDEFPRPSEGKALRTIFFWHYGTSFGARLWGAILAHAAFWTLLAAGSLIRIPYFRSALGGLLAVTIALGTSACVEALSRQGVDAVVIAPEVEVRSGNGTNFDLLLSKPVHSGVEVRVIETRGNWKQVEFPNEVRGWVMGSAVEEVAAGLR